MVTDSSPTDLPVTAPPSPEPPGTEATEAPGPRRRLALAKTIGSALVLVVVTLVVLLLVAVTIGPRLLPYQALVVRSGSMAPSIPTGSIVFYRSVAADKVKVGDVIVFNEPGETNKKVTHRVYQIKTDQTGRYFVTKGDANGAPDDWRVPAVGTGWLAVFHIPVAGYILYDLQSTLARLLLLLVPAILLGAITLYEIWHDRGRQRGSPA
jgi:signal peptidase I